MTDTASTGIHSSKEGEAVPSTIAAPVEQQPGPPKPPADNELPGETGPSVKASAFDKIIEGGTGLFRKFNIPRRRGRPPNCPTCGLPETQCGGHVGLDDGGAPRVIPSGQAVVDPPPGPPRDPVLIKRSIAAIARAFRKFGDKWIFQKAVEASGDKAYASLVRDETSATDDECDALGEVMDIVLKELGLDTKYLPLTAALVVVAGAGSRYYVTGRALSKAIREKNAKLPPKT